MTVKNAETASQRVAVMKDRCEQFVGMGDLQVDWVERFIDNLQENFVTASAAFTALVAHPKALEIAELHLSQADTPRDVSELQARFMAAVVAGQALVAEYAANVAPARTVNEFDAKTGTHSPAMLTSAQLAGMRTAAGALITALEAFTA